MTTDQKYDGKENHANSSESFEQTAQNQSQTERPTLSSDVFTFDELVIFDALPDTGKKIVADLVNSGNYRPKQLSRALLHISQTPDWDSLSSAVDQELLWAVLAGDPADEGTTAQPLTIEGAQGSEADPITIELPFFLRWQVRDQQQAINLHSAIETIFWAFSRSEIGKKLSEDVDQMMAYKALQFSIEDIVEKAAIRRLGSFTKPETEFPYSTPSLATGDPSMDYAPALTADPTQCTEIDALHEWICTLQQMARLQQRMNTTNVELRALQKEVNEGQKVIIDALTVQVKSLELSIESARRTAVQHEEDRDVPSANHYVSLALYLTGGYESEVEVVRSVLTKASKKLLKKVFKLISADEAENAYWAKQEYNKLQNVLSRLASQVTEVATDNYSRHSYTLRPQLYLSNTKAALNMELSRRDVFVKKYSVYTKSDEDNSENELLTPSGDASSSQDSTIEDALPPSDQ